MTLIDFISEYPDEVSCKSKFKQYRDHVGGHGMLLSESRGLY